jgi:hypothetical protein
MLTENEAPCQLNQRGIIKIFEDVGEYMNKIEGVYMEVAHKKTGPKISSKCLRLA